MAEPNSSQKQAAVELSILLHGAAAILQPTPANFRIVMDDGIPCWVEDAQILELPVPEAAEPELGEGVG